MHTEPGLNLFVSDMFCHISLGRFPSGNLNCGTSGSLDNKCMFIKCNESVKWKWKQYKSVYALLIERDFKCSVEQERLNVTSLLFTRSLFFALHC